MSDQQEAPLSSGVQRGISPRGFVQAIFEVNGPHFGMGDSEVREWAALAGLVGDVNTRSNVVRSRAAEAKASYLSDLLGQDWGAVALAWNVGIEEAWMMQAKGQNIEQYIQKNPRAAARLGDMKWGDILNVAAEKPYMGESPNMPAPPPEVSQRRGTLPGQIYDYLTQTHGLSEDSALGILANIQAESNFNTSAVGDGGYSFGLFQHHRGRADAMKQYAASRGMHWTDWRAQVDYAMVEAKAMSGWDPQSKDAAAASRWWTIYFERPANAQTKAEQRAGLVPSFQYLRGRGPVAPDYMEVGMQEALASRGDPVVPQVPQVEQTVFDPNQQPGVQTYDPNVEMGLYTMAALQQGAAAQQPAKSPAQSSLSTVLRSLSGIVRAGGSQMETSTPQDAMKNDVQVQ